MRACFYVTGHGFGHSARVQAVIRHWLQAVPDSQVEVRTSAPAWFFEGVLGPRCQLVPVDLDPGVVQSDSFHHDIPKTLAAWQDLFARAPGLIASEAAHLVATGVRVVLGDIGPLAFAAAAEAKIPALAMGNFTWDWILEPYLEQAPGFGPIIDAIRRCYRLATLYARLPMSPETDLFARQVRVPILARRASQPREWVREALGVSHDQVMVLVSFGGFGANRLDLRAAASIPGLRCVWDRPQAAPPWLISTATVDSPVKASAGMNLGPSNLLYSDLIRAADLVLTKPGFSIIAECMAQKTPLACARRTGFREAALLEQFLAESGWPHVLLSEEDLSTGQWVGPAVVLGRGPHRFPEVACDGAERVVDLLIGLAGRAR